jgi:hypothetical protein
MLQRTVTYSSLLRILGVCCLLYGLYVIVLALTAQIVVGGSIQYSGPMIFADAMDVENFIFYGGLFVGNPIVPGVRQLMEPLGIYSPGPLLWVGLGILSVTLSTRRVRVAYLGLQIALWMASASIWTPILVLQHSTQYGLGAVGPFFLVTLALSLVLLVLYLPVTHGLSWLIVPRDGRNTSPTSSTSGDLASS